MSVLKSLPASLQPWVDLMRLSRYAGTMLIFWPYAWGATMAARTSLLPVPRFFELIAYGLIGASLAHSAGCVWNDILDRNFDRKVARTKSRPIAAGLISVPKALVFLAAHYACMFYMIWTVNPLAWKVALTTMFPLAGAYPFMKRITNWPQAWLGISMNTGILMAWAFIAGDVPKSSWVLLGGAWAWTIWYDTIYACQDKKDDKKAGVKSTALLFGDNIKAVLGTFAALVVGALYYAGKLNDQQLPYFLISVLGGAVHMGVELYTVDTDSPKSCWAAFHRAGFHLGALIWTGFLADYLWSMRGTILPHAV
ncbi:hypothetical protein HGRIS_000139 [Hohenbuehelia grisea]|uniref:4-hydroxybenzoate polyprenyltransferase, mitochondrial n=1 Tax=Hohenbuehelia grisea TaxID=104357 RepID=A0ABR3JQ57_9AGAR